MKARISVRQWSITAAYFFYFSFLVFWLIGYFDITYPYLGIENHFSELRIVISALLLLLTLMPLKILDAESPIVSIMHMFMVLSVVPTYALYASAGVAFWACLAYLYFILILTFFGKINWGGGGRKYVSEYHQSLFLIVVSIFSAAIFFNIHGTNISLNVFTLSAEDIYEVRNSANEERSIFDSYLYSWSTKIFLPLAIVHGVIARKRFLVIFGVVCMSYLFATSGHKSVLLSVALLLLLSGSQSFSKKNQMLLGIFLAVCSFSFLIYKIFGADVAQSILIRRLLILPGILNQYYYEIYSQQLAYYSHSFLSSIIDNPYSGTPPYVVGQVFFGLGDVSFNNGFVSDGYANLGYLGAWLHATILAFLLACFCRLGISSRYYGFLFIFVYQFNTSATATTLLQHGFIVLICLAYFGFLTTRPRFKPAAVSSVKSHI
jgi:hypothetical protein